MVYMGFYIVSGLVIAVVLFLVIDSLVEKHRAKLRDEALEYLLQTTERVYFYGQPVSMCLQKGVVSELYWSNLGDFSKPFGILVLYALHVQGNNDACLYWRHRSVDEEMLPERNTVLVNFKYGRRRWELRVLGRRLDEISFHQGTVSPSQNYLAWTYMNGVPRKNQLFSENCTDPNRSNLAPDYYYINLPKAEFDAEVNKVLGHLFLLG